MGKQCVGRYGAGIPEPSELRLHPFPYATATTTQYTKWDHSRHTLLATNPFALSTGYLYPYAIHPTCAEFLPKPRIEFKSTSLQPNLSNSMATSAMEHPPCHPSSFSFHQPKPAKKQHYKGEPLWRTTPLGFRPLPKLKMKSSSRWIAQRRNKRNSNLANSKLFAEQQLKLEQTLRATKHCCFHQYGCFADPKYSLQKNFNIQISHDEPTAKTQPKNLGFHNLCSKNKLPLGTKQLLGLNLNFYLAPTSPRDNISKTVLKMARSIRIKYFLDQHGLSNDEEYNKQIYINNTGWHPPPAPLNIENHITNFEKALKLKQQEVMSKNKNRPLPNLTPLQLSALRKLQSNSKIIIKPTDKNLGPAVLDTETYVNQVLQEPLNTKHYQLLSNTESRNRYEAFRTALKDLITTNIDCLSKAEVLYFQRSFKLRHRLPIFYGLPKVHKSPISLRPVVSSVNSFSKGTSSFN
jgi:hypothetical protein